MKSSAVKDKVLETATRLFYGQGYNLTGINQVIDEAGVARGSLYYNFESKTDLLLTYLDKCSRFWFEEIDKFLLPIESPREKLLGLFDFEVLFQERLNFGGCPFIKITSEVGSQYESVSAEVKQFKLTFKQYISDLVKGAHIQGVLSDEELTDMIFFLLDGVDVSSTIFSSTEQILKARKIVNKLL
ncbi:AcrR family transcriptional regulator [Pedobacter cryoconitis]|uniref:TetR/AcrR family transcriptional regulator n=1 Tax=Pedobacter cryoconitis TaxID=188932 RepID=UPI00162167CF|nr:TetR/AcrR family transcriptional regulator [Pedobacter cryoconitis]MBB6270955.1 AcrR family transcriptional regulator [Pedobacter cryoconitis]